MAKAQIGKKIPKFSLETTAGALSDKDLAGKRTVLYFYPKDDTPGCTVEGQEFAEQHARFKRAGIAVYGISRDTLRSHERFRDKYGFPFALISDPDETLCAMFGVMRDKNMYGRKVRGIERSTFLLDSKAVLKQEWRKVKPEGHAAEVLEAARRLD